MDAVEICDEMMLHGKECRIPKKLLKIKAKN